MPSKRHLPLAFAVALFALQGCDARPLAVEIISVGSYFAIFLVFLGRVKAIPQNGSALISSSSTSHSGTSSSNTASTVPTSSTNHTVSTFIARTISTLLPTTLARVLTGVSSDDAHTTSQGRDPDTPATSSSDANVPYSEFEDIIAKLAEILDMTPAEVKRMAFGETALQTAPKWSWDQSPGFTSTSTAPDVPSATSTTPPTPSRTAKKFSQSHQRRTTKSDGDLPPSPDKDTNDTDNIGVGPTGFRQHDTWTRSNSIGTHGFLFKHLGNGHVGLIEHPSQISEIQPPTRVRIRNKRLLALLCIKSGGNSCWSFTTSLQI